MNYNIPWELSTYPKRDWDTILRLSEDAILLDLMLESLWTDILDTLILELLIFRNLTELTLPSNLSICLNIMDNSEVRFQV